MGCCGGAEEGVPGEGSRGRTAEAALAPSGCRVGALTFRPFQALSAPGVRLGPLFCKGLDGGVVVGGSAVLVGRPEFLDGLAARSAFPLHSVTSSERSLSNFLITHTSPG